ncbi:hypothetical protein HYW18_04260 [Candidatus Uhrbacteria bacterium]|nr:hypothetical protein [Candidatus Uhrbacteria bacterium]
MYFYVYDEFLSDRSFERDLIAVENRLADLGIAGRVARLALFKHAKSFVGDELRKGHITTVVAVGNDATVQKVIEAMQGHDVVLGLIPFGAPTRLSQMLGVPQGVAAVDVLSARNIEWVDAGRLNGERFLTGVQFPDQPVRVHCAEGYSLASEDEGTVEIRNLAGDIEEGDVADPTDGELEVVILTRTKGLLRRRPARSMFRSKSLTVEYQQPVTAVVEGKEVKGERFTVTVEPKVLRVITGKGRKF